MSSFSFMKNQLLWTLFKDLIKTFKSAYDKLRFWLDSDIYLVFSAHCPEKNSKSTKSKHGLDSCHTSPASPVQFKTVAHIN